MMVKNGVGLSVKTVLFIIFVKINNLHLYISQVFFCWKGSDLLLTLHDFSHKATVQVCFFSSYNRTQPCR